MSDPHEEALVLLRTGDREPVFHARRRRRRSM